MKSKIILIIFVLACSDLFSQNILDKADKVWREIAEKSIYFDSVDSSQLKETFYAKIGDNTEMGNFMDALLYLQATLEDSHSKLIYKDSTISNFDFERLPLNTLEFYAIIQEQSGQIPLENNSTSVIGESTFGYTTGIEILDLGDGLLFLYSSSYPVNFYDHDYLYHVVPEVLLEGGDNFIDLEKDAKVIEALKWFKAEK